MDESATVRNGKNVKVAGVSERLAEVKWERGMAVRLV